jgi:hypothetical protein
MGTRQLYSLWGPRAVLSTPLSCRPSPHAGGSIRHLLPTLVPDHLDRLTHLRGRGGRSRRAESGAERRLGTPSRG